MITKEKAKEYRDRGRQKLRDAGLCIHCGKAPKKETSQLCQPCTTKNVERRKILAEKKTKQGFCSSCLTRKAEEGMRLCGHCLKMKRGSPQDKLRKRCLTYGITEQDYYRMIDDQDNKCLICGSGPGGRWGQFDIDHCHDTGKVRGLLCHECNKGLGCFRDNKESLKKAIEYLEK